MTPKELMAQATPLTYRIPIVAGIYMIYCSANEKGYIGSSLRVQARFTHHRHDLRRGAHDNTHLQRAYAKYGKEAFTYLLVEACPKPTTPEILLERENHYLMQLDEEDVFNVVIPAMLSMVGYKRKPEQVAAFAAFNKGNKYAKGLQVSPEIRAAVSARFKGKAVPLELVARRKATRKANDAANPERIRSGARHGMAKLTEENVREIRKQRAAGGVTQAALAQKFGVTGVTISSIILRKTWTNLADDQTSLPDVGVRPTIPPLTSSS